MTKEEWYGTIGASIFCLLIFLFLYLTVIKTTVKAREEGVLLNFGKVDWDAGTFEPRSEEPQGEINLPEPVQAPVSRPETPPVTPKKTQKPIVRPKTPPAVQPKTQKNTIPQKSATPPITQSRENTAAIEAARKEQEEKNRLAAEQQAQRAKEVAEQRKRDSINRQISGAFGSGTGAQNHQGAQTGVSGKGNPQGTSSGGSSSGSGYGEFNLSGRTLGPEGLPRPSYSIQEEGRIIVNITVAPNGNVIFAEIGKGTNIDNNVMQRSALEAARKAKFNSISGNNNQSGTITYRYLLK